MDCEKAQYLIMKFIDGNILDNEEFALNLHSKNCDECFLQFDYAKKIIEPSLNYNTNFTHVEFENNVMSEVKVVSKPCVSLTNYERLICVLFSLLSIFAGISSTIIVFKNAIQNFLSSHQSLSIFVSFFAKVEICFYNAYNQFNVYLRYVFFNINFYKICATILIMFAIVFHFFVIKKRNVSYESHAD